MARAAASPDIPFALTETGRHGMVIAHANAPALAGAVTPGLGQRDARARLPGLVLAPWAQEEDARALHRLALWLRSQSPLVMVAGENMIALDITGCEGIFGPEADWATRVRQRLKRDGYTLRLAMAPTLGGAIALARHGPEDITAVDQAGLGRALAPLPVEGLRIDAESQQLLHRFGLHRMSQLDRLPRAALERRFHQALAPVLRRRDEALGLRAEPFHPLLPPTLFRVAMPCPEPLLQAEAVGLGLASMAGQLCQQLSAQGRGGRQFFLMLHRVDGSVQTLRLNCARPLCDAVEMQRLFATELERADPGFGIDRLVLEAVRTAPLCEDHPSLARDLAAPGMDERALGRLADRVRARLGPMSVRVAGLRDAHLPEEADRLVRFDGALAGTVPRSPRVSGHRPVRLLDPPEPIEVIAELPDGPPQHFRWRKRARRTRRAEGPERLCPPWWDSDPLGEALPAARDYFTLEDEEACRFWVFRLGDYGGDNPPRWFLHGLMP